MALLRWVGVLSCLALSCGAAWGKVSIGVEPGWGGAYRPGYWTPVLVTVSDPAAAKPRNGVLTIASPYGIDQNLNVSQRIVITPGPSTFLVYLPLSPYLSQTIATVREESGRIAAEAPFDRRGDPEDYYRVGMSGQGELVIGVSGRRTQLSELGQRIDWLPGQSQNDEVSLRVGYLPPALLPDTVMGFDTLDLLVLHSPDLAAIPLDRQQVIVDWVKGGGKLLMWAGDGVVPPDSPIARALPVELGEVRPTAITLEDAKKLGVQARVERLPGRAITVKAGAAAATVPLLPGKEPAVVGRVGFGRVAVLPYDPTVLAFNDPDAAMKVWRPFLADVLWPAHSKTDFSLPGQNKPQAMRYMNSNDFIELDNWRAGGMEVVIDRLGNVPGIGRFDFSYVAWVLLAMMLIVGPVDWFVLKKLGRQPWTWATISGWCVLITVGALYMGRVFKSGDLHYRTMKLVEQDGGQVVGVTEVAGIYTPKTAPFAVKGGDYLWWQPAKTDNSERYRQRRQHGTKFDFVQDRRGQQLMLRGEDEPVMFVPIWNLRFMQGTDAQPGDTKPVIAAELTLVGKGGGAQQVKGTVKNLSGGTMRNVCVWVNEGIAMATTPNQSPDDFQGQRPAYMGPSNNGTKAARVKVGSALQPEVAGGKQVEFAAPVHAAGPAEVSFAKKMSPSRRWYYSESSSGSSSEVNVPEMAFVRGAMSLNPERTQRVIEMFGRGEAVACVLAEVEVAASDVKLIQGSPMEAKQRHWQVVRAVVPIRREE